MRFPSLIKIPRNKRFQIEPRYYDPVKEEIEDRTRRIKDEMEGRSSDGLSDGKRISFERKTSSVPNTSFLQLIIAAVLGITTIGWLFYGNQIFYALWGVVPFYLYYRFRKKSGSKE